MNKKEDRKHGKRKRKRMDSAISEENTKMKKGKHEKKE